MHGFAYWVLWVLLSFFPLVTAWKRRWLAFAVYMAGWLLFLYSVSGRQNDGWEDLAAIATLIAIVLPIYAVASIIWLIGVWRDRRVRK